MKRKCTLILAGVLLQFSLLMGADQSLFRDAVYQHQVLRDFAQAEAAYENFFSQYSPSSDSDEVIQKAVECYAALLNETGKSEVFADQMKKFRIPERLYITFVKNIKTEKNKNVFVSISFQNTSAAEILRVINQIHNCNIVFPENLENVKISIQAKDKELKDLLFDIAMKTDTTLLETEQGFLLKNNSTGKKEIFVSLSFKNASAGNILRVINASYGGNIVFPGSLEEKKISIQAKDRELKDLLFDIARQTGTTLLETEQGFLLEDYSQGNLKKLKTYQWNSRASGPFENLLKKLDTSDYSVKSIKKTESETIYTISITDSADLMLSTLIREQTSYTAFFNIYRFSGTEKKLTGKPRITSLAGQNAILTVKSTDPEKKITHEISIELKTDFDISNSNVFNCTLKAIVSETSDIDNHTASFMESFSTAGKKTITLYDVSGTKYEIELELKK